MQIPNEIPIPIEADHRSMCRFSSKASEKYQMVFDCLQELVDDAVGKEQPCKCSGRNNLMWFLSRA
jgi:hypothetical protein